jgi:hypothetical protein
MTIDAGKVEVKKFRNMFNLIYECVPLEVKRQDQGQQQGPVLKSVLPIGKLLRQQRAIKSSR